jgi:hypothetical protein
MRNGQRAMLKISTVLQESETLYACNHDEELSRRLDACKLISIMEFSKVDISNLVINLYGKS